ncbi:aspartyl-phosphate phosphatase Spo0E family protein [Sporosalibacterium faouarense]|uniref:aspartyl-phosphate phosphatase Spo0E family protein n=1 Tax=Sporosalibacterium faouarense TaxID=516123 RepID=UPI00141C2B30|nr:aspartyl-phosphate phosphatase Spo0E family protein [Sporosalibacterium faouarense]MTI46710.1 Spo0E family sporulation regulatory protein-aspartic acid phosphatase [Bacillota bacterium]
MNDLVKTIELIEKLRKDLYKILEENNGDLTNKRVIKESQKLDNALAQYNKILQDKKLLVK